MSLNWHIEEIKNYKELCWDKDKNLNPITDVLIWCSLGVSIGEITIKNWKDFYLRVHLQEEWRGTYLNDKKGKPKYITKQDVFNHIGLYTNVSNESRSKWLNRFFKREQEKLTLKGTE